MTVRFSGLIGLAVYLGIGSLFYAMFVDPHFDWTSAWIFGWLLAWPIMLFITFWVTVMAGIVALLVCVAILAIISNLKDRKRARAARKLKEFQKELWRQQKEG